MAGTYKTAVTDGYKLIRRLADKSIIGMVDEENNEHFFATYQHDENGNAIAILNGDGGANVPKLARNLIYAKLPKWQKAVGRVLSGGRARMLILGNSTEMGAGAGASGQTLLVDAFQRNFPSALARALSRMGIPALNGHFFGNQNIGATSVTYPEYDPRLSLPVAGWFSAGATYESIGAYMWRCNTNGGKLAFAPTQPVDTIEVFYPRNSGLGSYTVDVDGGASLGTVNTNGALGVVSQKFTTTLGQHVINYTATSATIMFQIGSLAYNSKEPAVDIIQSGWWGGLISNWNGNANAWNPRNAYAALAPDLTIIQMTINDIAQTTTASNYNTQMRSVVDSLIAAGSDVILMTGIPSDPNAYPNFGTTKVAEFYGIVKQIAADKGCLFVDFSEFLGGSYAAAHTKYGMSDSSHGSSALYGAEAFFVGNILSTLAID